MRWSFIYLDEKFKIFETSDRSRFKTSDDAADVWRKMLKDAVAIKKSNDFSEKLRPLMEALRIPDRVEPTKSAAAPSTMVPAPLPDEDESDIDGN